MSVARQIRPLSAHVRLAALIASVTFGVALFGSLAASLGCATAAAQPVGYLYSALESSIDEYEVGADMGLTFKGYVPGSGVSPNNPSTLAMARTADGENLYQLEATGGSQAVRQYSVASDGKLSAKTPAAVGSVHEASVEDPHFMAVFNPAATGEPGQNALYVLSAGTELVGEREEPAEIAIFDIDAATGALTPAGVERVPDLYSPFGFAYSGKRMAILGYDVGDGLQVAEVEPSTGQLKFAEFTDAPCGPHVGCIYPPLAMADSEQMLSRGEDETHEIFPAFLDSAPAYEVGAGWGNIANNPVGQHLGPSAITADGDLYYVTSFDPLEVYTGNEEKEFPEKARGESWVEAFTVDGEPDGSFQLPAQGGIPAGIFALGSALYISTETYYYYDTFEKGAGFRLASGQPPTQVSEAKLGSAITGFLLGSSAGGGSEAGETEEAGSTGTGSGSSGEKSSGSSETPSPGGGAGGSTGAGSSGGGPLGTCASLGSCIANPAPAVNVAKLAPPNTKILSVKLSGAKTTIKFTGTGGYGKLSFRCKLGKAKKSVKCQSPLVYHHLAAGEHHLSVDAVDSRPVADPTPAKIGFATK
jgi:hypothetical protein